MALAFFDPMVDAAEKREMVANLQRPARRIVARRGKKPLRLHRYRFPGGQGPESLVNVNLAHFVKKKTLSSFDQMEINSDFLHLDPTEWSNYLT